MKTPDADFQDDLRRVMTEAGVTRQQAADLMRVSLHTVHSWLKPRGNRSASKTPLGAVELLALKTGAALPEVQPISEGSAST